MQLIGLVIRNDASAIRHQIEAGTWPNAADEAGKTPLIWAAELKRLESLRVLLEVGADANIRDRRGRTALMYAAGRQFDEAISALVSAGAATQVMDVDGQTALWYSMRREINFTLPWPPAWHGTVTLRRWKMPRTARLIVSAQRAEGPPARETQTRV